MKEVRVHGRFGQPVGKLVAALSRHAGQKGKHVQIFNCFAAYRPGGPMYTVLRTAEESVRQRSANNTCPDVVVVLDNSLFASQDVTKGLKPGGTVPRSSPMMIARCRYDSSTMRLSKSSYGYER